MIKKRPNNENCFDNFKRFTTENFSKFVAPILREKFNAIEVHDTESLDDEEFKRLDQKHCIDGYIVTSDGTREYFANRIQRGHFPTFTVRKNRDTGHIAEYERLCKLIARGELYPKWFIQSYIQKDSVTVALVDTQKLVEYIQSVNPPVRHTRIEHIGQADFFVCYWTALKKFGADVIIFKNKKSA